MTPAECVLFVQRLREGGVIACPTETLQGLLADALNESAVARVVALKRRGQEPIALLVPDIDAVDDLIAGALPARVRELAAAHWPGPLTLVLRARPGLASVLAPRGTIGVRVPGPSPALDIVRAFGGPLTATSCNLSGQPPARTQAEVASYFAGELAAIVPGDAPGGLPSTVVDATGDELRVLRAGALDVRLPNRELSSGAMAEPKAQNLTWHDGHLGRTDRERLLGQRGATLWFTGLSGSGKSTVARRVEQLLAERRQHVYTLDGDNVRHGLCSDLGFSPEDRTENIRRIGEVCKLFTDAGTLTLAAFVSPYRADRARVRGILAEGDFLEVYVAADLAVCESRDPKGLYRKARAGQIPEFTGISAPYEAPEQAEITLHTDRDDVDACAQAVVRYLAERGIIPTS